MLYKHFLLAAVDHSQYLSSSLLFTLFVFSIGLDNLDLAQRFGLSDTHISTTLTTWYNFLEIELKLLFEFVDDAENTADVYADFPDLQFVVDCTEQRVQRSSDLQARKELFSNYKHHDTIKWMVSLSRNLTCNYVSVAYGGRASDKFITMDCKSLLQSLSKGKSVMADRGFTVTEELKKLGVELIIPNFKGRDRSQLTVEECEGSEYIAKARIHIEVSQLNYFI